MTPTYLPEGTTHDEDDLGDGVLATFDGYQIILSTPRSEAERVLYENHWIGLEPNALAKLVDFANYINIKYKVHHFKWRV